ncbi:hypothetical protein [Salinisphaera sp.]|uniref:hypothetical protein n=1 Tax=Salinisphaera sp. TaxID=1914330 RepID=UPI002D7768BC|nr:hypothetical protein [Salinisphaera sp.]HET7313102.1 hypothetical protein [Salinisphaera sp.]
MQSNSSFRQIIVGTVAALAVLGAGPAFGKDSQGEGGYCPNALPDPSRMSTKQMAKYGDYETNPAHTKRQYERAKLNFHRRNDCARWIHGTAPVAVLSYKLHRNPPDPRTRKITAHDRVKKESHRMKDSYISYAIEHLQRKYIDATVDLAYQGKSQKEIDRELYCACLSDYPVAWKADERRRERYNKTHSE